MVLYGSYVVTGNGTHCFACISSLFARLANQVVQAVFTATCDVVFNYPVVSVRRNERLAFHDI